MKSDNIEEILNRLGTEDVPADARQIAQKLSRDFSETLKPQRKHILLEYIMKSRITKLAAAAVILIGVLVLFLFNFGPGSIALADVYAKVQQAQAFKWKERSSFPTSMA
ncbi:MAG: hypothetical protein ACYS9C_20035 [Planctomycetota bacterium]|jgi:hypothetical protein